MELIDTLVDIVTNFVFEHQFETITILGGLLPALLWTIFWIREGECEETPDPKTGITYICFPKSKWLLFLSFIFGGLVVLPTIIVEKIVTPFFGGISLVVAWATIEEVFKFLVFWLIDFKTKKLREPQDALVYLSVVALGFSAVENSLFLYQALVDGTLTNAYIGQNYRFLGASILHVLSSGFIGICIGYTFFTEQFSKGLSIGVGILGAISLHSLFNYLIIMDSNQNGLTVPSIIWSIGALYLILIEGLRYLAIKHKRRLYEAAHGMQQ